MQTLKLDNKAIFESKYEFFKTIDFVYTFVYEIIPSIELFKKNLINLRCIGIKDISNEFYEGFGINI